MLGLAGGGQPQLDRYHLPRNACRRLAVACSVSFAICCSDACSVKLAVDASAVGYSHQHWQCISVCQCGSSIAHSVTGPQRRCSGQLYCFR